MIHDYLEEQKEKGVDMKTKIMIGDGFNDMEAGVHNKCVCFGVGSEDLMKNGAHKIFMHGELEYQRLGDEILAVLESE